MSVANRGGCCRSNVGVRFPILALKSPQMIVVSWGWCWSIMSSTRVVAVSSNIFLFFREVLGGRYTFAMLILLLFGSVIFARMQYSLLFVHDISSFLCMYIAIPPLVLFFRLSSIML